MSFVIFAEAKGSKGAVKLAWQHPTEPSSGDLTDARSIATAQYRRLYEEWPDTPHAFFRDETNAPRPTFR